MSIYTSRGGSQSRSRKQSRSLKADRAVTVARRAGIRLFSYRNEDIIRAVVGAGYKWNPTLKQWELS